MELMYPHIVWIGILIVIFLVLFSSKKKHAYTDGKKVANTKYTKSIPYYQEVVKKYKMLTNLIKLIAIICVILSLILLARPIIIENSEIAMYKRDIFLCLDVSKSVDKLNIQLVHKLKDIVENLKGERFGITIFNTSSVLLSPLTDDYEYVQRVLDMLYNSLDNSIDYQVGNDDAIYLSKYLLSGTIVGNETRGSSIIGDGLASCLYNFPDLDEERTRIVIFSTDNDLAGDEIVTLQEAAEIAKEKNIIVYGIAPNTIKLEDQKELKKAIETTGGTYYTETTNETVDEIVEDIEKKQKSLIQDQKQTRKIDNPQIPFIILVFSIIVLFVLNRRVNL